MAKLNFQDVSTMYGVSTFTSLTTGLVGGILWQHLGGQTDYLIVTAGTWFLSVGVPSVIYSTTKLNQLLGKKHQTTVKTTMPKDATRAIPYTNGKQSGNIFLSALGIGEPVKSPSFQMPNMFHVKHLYLPGNDTPCDVTLPENRVNEFIFGAYHRQQRRKAPFSRNYWMKFRTPKMEYDTYYGMIFLLESHGLIINRRHGKSGNLPLQPSTAIKHLKYSYGLKN